MDRRSIDRTTSSLFLTKARGARKRHEIVRVLFTIHAKEGKYEDEDEDGDDNEDEDDNDGDNEKVRKSIENLRLVAGFPRRSSIKISLFRLPRVELTFVI